LVRANDLRFGATTKDDDRRWYPGHQRDAIEHRSPPPRHQFASRLNDACRGGPAAMRMGAVMRDGSNLYVTPARVGLILVALIVLGVTVGRIITVLGQSDASTHTTRGNGGQVTVDIGVADLRGSLP
jgi:hypothetical protein